MADNRRIIYERRTFSAVTPPGPPRLWWLDSVTGETGQVFEDNQWLGMTARPSADERWLGYLFPLAQELQLFNLQTGDLLKWPTRTGQPMSWHPEGTAFVFSEGVMADDRFAIHIFRVEMSSYDITDLTGETSYTDGSPVWSPDGNWIAFTRKIVQEPMGQQIWMMRPDGSNPTALTADPNSQYGPPSWSSDGRYLISHRFLLSEAASRPGIVLLDIETGEERIIAAVGIQPSWSP